MGMLYYILSICFIIELKFLHEFIINITIQRSENEHSDIEPELSLNFDVIDHPDIEHELFSNSGIDDTLDSDESLDDLSGMNILITNVI